MNLDVEGPCIDVGTRSLIVRQNRTVDNTSWTDFQR